ncbi:MAG: betaine--homocysteine S-methyltransferase [Pseudomonadota bacterium]
MTNPLSRLLEARGCLLLDGATGTNLFAMGLMSGDAPELWNLEAPEKIRALHDGFVAAGSDLILTNSFGGSAYRLKLHDAQDRVFALNKAAAEIARASADAAGRPVVVAGSLGPTGEILEPVGSLSHAEAVAAFEEQIEGLIAGGADVIWAETLSSEEELRAAAEAAANKAVPFCATLSFDTAGRTMMGVTSHAYAQLAPGLATAPIAIGANCGTGAPDLLRTVLGLTEAAPDRIVIAKANAGIPKYVDGQIEYDGTPELMAEYVRLAMDAGARLIGGCCGTTYRHVAAMRAAMDSHSAGERPSLEDIRMRIGDFSSSSDGTEPETEGAARRPRRSRRRG